MPHLQSVWVSSGGVARCLFTYNVHMHSSFEDYCDYCSKQPTHQEWIHYTTDHRHFAAGWSISWGGINSLCHISLAHTIILGFPWFNTHGLMLSWQILELIHWSPCCIDHCLQRKLTLPSCTNPVESPEPTHTVIIPREYQDLQEVFTKEWARFNFKFKFYWSRTKSYTGRHVVTVLHKKESKKKKKIKF